MDIDGIPFWVNLGWLLPFYHLLKVEIYTDLLDEHSFAITIGT